MASANYGVGSVLLSSALGVFPPDCNAYGIELWLCSANLSVAVPLPPENECGHWQLHNTSLGKKKYAA